MQNQQILSEVFVQILGFGVVFFVLKKLAWSKLLGAIDERRKGIEASFADIERRKASIDALEKEYRAKLEKIEQEARAKIQEAAQLGQALARDIQEKAREDAQKALDRAKSEIEQDLAKARLTLRDDIVSVSGLMTEKVLREKLDPQAHAKLVDRFIKEIGRS